MLKIKLEHLKELHALPAVWLAWVAAILYCSWPIGYVLNPAVGRHDLASQLESLHQPFNWLFITMDVLTGVAVTGAGAWQINKHGKHALFKWCVAGYVAFGLFNALAAAMPLNCNPEAHDCGPLLHNPVLVVHGISSILSVVFLLLSLLVLGIFIYQRHEVVTLRWLYVSALLGWALFGCGYLVEVLLRTSSNMLQYYFITVCSLSIVLVIGGIEYLRLREAHRLQPEPAIEE